MTFASQAWSLDRYINDVCRHEILSHSETITLIETAQADWYPKPSDPQRLRQGKRARDRLITHNMKFALQQIAKHRKGYPIEDLLGGAAIGLDEAIEGFDSTSGYSFLTYAAWKIRSAVQRERQKHSSTIAIPIWVRELQDTIRAIVREAGEEKLSIEEIDTLLQGRCKRARPGDARLVLEAMAVSKARSLDQILYEDRSLADVVAIDYTSDPMAYALRQDEARYLAWLIDRTPMSLAQRQVLRLRCQAGKDGEPMQFKEIAKRLGLSVANAHGHCTKGIAAVRRYAESCGEEVSA